MKKIFICALVLISAIFAQEKTDPVLTGSLNFDMAFNRGDVSSQNYLIQNNGAVQKKSTLLAGAMSLIIPGAGEIYSGSYLKAGLFLVAEAALIYLKLDYDRQGDDQTDYYRGYANGHWSPAKYAQWSIQKFGIDETKYTDLFNSDKSAIQNWKTLNQLESEISTLPNGKYYSHHLAPYGDQQYYEMIGKYQQFVPGWSEFEGDYNYGDPILDQYLNYSKERGKANDFYNKASTAMAVVIVNHVLSAIDAVLSANSFNKSLDVKVTLEKDVLGFEQVYHPELNLKFRF